MTINLVEYDCCSTIILVIFNVARYYVLGLYAKAKVVG